MIRLLMYSQTFQLMHLRLNDESFSNLLVKYTSQNNVNVRKTDTLTNVELQFIGSMGGGYDAVIANPRYGARRNPKERKKLKSVILCFYADVLNLLATCKK